ncbi:MAG: S41 family peptidase [Flavobacteriaceae bacterium]|nr:S41 family peptidase [Flavobacteriaceae bacterium]
MKSNVKNLPIIVAIAVVLGMVIGNVLNYEKGTVVFRGSASELKMKRLMDYIEYDYVDEVDVEELLDDAITVMLKKLDPHSVYIPKDKLQRITETMQGKFDGIGVQFLMHQDTVTITKVMPNGPSKKAGLQAGDRILISNNDTLFGRDYSSTKIMGFLKGSSRSKIKLTIYRRSLDSVLSIDLKRGKIAIASVAGYHMMSDHIGYIYIERFARTTYDEFKIALTELQARGMKTLVLDLRNNPGGFMGVANRIIDEFLEDDKLIVFTKSKNGSIQESFATEKGAFETGDLYVLINENSASASEIVAGALQDNDKGTIVGRRSFGKGLVQQEMDLGDGSAVRLTTSRYYTPTGRSIQKPYSHTDNEKYYHSFMERMQSGELVSKDSIKVVDSLKFTTPKGKVVYGGGGIIPDVFVGIDTKFSLTNRLFMELNNWVFIYVDNHRAPLKKWQLEDFVLNFDKKDKILASFIASLDEKTTLTSRVKEELKLYLRALVAQQLFDDLGYYTIIRVEDPMIKKVMELDAQN